MKRLALPSSTQTTRLPRWRHILRCAWSRPCPSRVRMTGVFAHIGVEEIVDRGHQALVPDHQPGATEDLLHLVVVDRLLAEDAAVELAGGGVDDDILPSGAPDPPSRGDDSRRRGGSSQGFQRAMTRDRQRLSRRTPPIAGSTWPTSPGWRMSARARSSDNAAGLRGLQRVTRLRPRQHDSRVVR